MFHVYAIKSKVTDHIYIGQTKDIKHRLSIHNNGYVKSTYKGVPWILIAMQTFNTRQEARWCERQLKTSRGKRAKWIEHNLIT